MTEIKDKIMGDQIATKTIIKAKIKDKTFIIISKGITEIQEVAIQISTNIKAMLNLEEEIMKAKIKNTEWLGGRDSITQ